MADLPPTFVCDVCAKPLHTDLLCSATQTAVALLCLRCCDCSSHDQDVEGVVVYPWRGLDERARRHQ